MVLLSELVQGKAGKSWARQMSQAQRQPQSLSLLQGRLQQIAQAKGRSGGQLSQALRTAKGGSPSVGAKLLGSVGAVLGAPMRAIVATGEEFGETFGLGEDDRSWWENFTDSNYGFGHVVERAGKNWNPWLKRGLGFVGDVAFDPLTYVTFGASAGLKTVGRSTGLMRIALEAADQAEGVGKLLRADELRSLAGRIGQEGAHKLSTAELDDLAELGGRAAGDFRYGIHLDVPFTRLNKTLPAGAPAEWYGRSLEGAGRRTVRSVRDTRIGSKLAGNMGLVREAIESGDPIRSRIGLRVKDAWEAAQGRASNTERELAKFSGPLLRDSRKAGLDGKEIMQGLREAPTTVKGVESAGGPTYEALINDPVKGPYFQQWLDHMRQMPEFAQEMARYDQQAIKVIHDATEQGRPYAMRVMSDEIREKANLRQGRRTKPGESTWMQKKAYTVGDEIGDGQFKTRIGRPGTPDDAGGMYPAIEDQVRDVMQRQFGDDFVEWYEPDFYKALPKYEKGIAEAVRNAHVQNVLHSKGISNERYTWLLEGLSEGERKLTIKEVANRANKVMTRLQGETDTSLGQLSKINGELDQVRADVAERRIGVDEAQARVRQLTRQKQETVARIAKTEDTIGETRRQLTRAQREENTALDAADRTEVEIGYARQEIRRLTDQINKMDVQAEEAWPALRELVAQREQAEQTMAQLMVAGDRVPRLYENAARNYAVADEIERALQTGDEMMPGDPLFDMVEEVADQLDLPINDPNTVGQIAQMLRGSADRDLEELASYVPLAPATGNVQQLRGQLGGAMRRMKAAGQALVDATDQESFDTAKAAYEQAATEASHRRLLLNLHREYGGAPTLGSMDEAQQVAFRQALDTQAALTAGLSTPHERAQAVLANQMEAWARTTEGAGPLANPAGGSSWYHGWRTMPVNVDGQFPLDQALRRVDEAWMDYLFAPSTSSHYGLASMVVESDPQKVQEIIFNTRPDRTRIYGPRQTMDEMAAGVNERGAIGPEMGREIDQLDPEDLGEHIAGPSYEMFRTDTVSRLMDENPALLDEFLAFDHLPAETREAFSTARQLQNYARGTTHRLTFAQALDLVGAEGPGPHLFDLLDDPLVILPGPDDYLPHASRLANAVYAHGAPARASKAAKAAFNSWRARSYQAIRQSMARDYDVIVFSNISGVNATDLNHPPFVQALPTNQFTMQSSEPLVEEGTMRGLADTLGDTERAYTGKHVNRAVRDDLTSQLANASEYLARVNNQFTARADDLARATAKRQETERKLWRAAANQDKSAATLAAKEADLRDAERLYNARASMLTESEARVATLEGQAKELSGELLNQRREQAYAGEMGERVARLRETLGQSWEGFGYNREAPGVVNEMLADINKSYDSMTGEGLSKFLAGFDRVNGWMKGWLTASVGFQTRNLFGGTFNNWLGGVRVTKAGKEWGDILFRKMTPRAIAAGTTATPWEQAAFNIGSRMGVVRSGLFTSELGMLEGTIRPGAQRGWGISPVGGIREGSKPFILPFLTRKMGEQATEPFLRGSMYYDDLSRAVEQQRFADIGIRSVDDVTAENMVQFQEAVLASSFVNESIDRIYKYHFNYDDLSQFERQVMRRVIPFYTWTRKNVPLQLEALATDPGKALNRYMAVKRNLELGTEDEDIVPSYFGEQAMIHLPWQIGGSDLYGTVELPFKDPFKVADVTGQLQGMLNPLIKAPLEIMAGKQFFSDVPLTSEYKEMPATWTPLIPFMMAGAALPFVPWDKPVKSATGQWMMRDKDAYLFQQYLPFLGQTRRLLPSEDKYENRLWSTAMSYLMGVNMRTNTPQDQESEIFRRVDTLTSMVNDLEATGRIPTKPKRQRRRSTMDLSTMLATIPSRTDRPLATEELPEEEEEVPAQQA